MLPAVAAVAEDILIAVAIINFIKVFNDIFPPNFINKILSFL